MNKMQTSIFFESFFRELISEVKSPVVAYKGVGRYYEEDPSVSIIDHKIVYFNNSPSLTDYQQKIGNIGKTIIAKLEKEIQENVIWMMGFDLDEVINELDVLQDMLEYKYPDKDGKTKTLPFQSIEALNIGDTGFYNTVDDRYTSTDFESSIHCRKRLESSLRLYARELFEVIEMLKSSFKWTFYKFHQVDAKQLKAAYAVCMDADVSGEVKTMIKDGKVDRCFDTLTGLFENDHIMSNQLLLLSNRYNRARQLELAGTVDFEVINREKNKVVQALIWLISK